MDPQLSCGLLYLSFWVADKTGIDGHVSFLPQKKKKEQKRDGSLFSWVEESLHVHRCQSYQHSERQMKQTTEECRVRSTSYDKGSRFAMA